MFGQSRKKLFKPKFLKEIFEGERKPIKHEMPASLTEDGQQHFGADGHDFQFFDEFQFFGNIVNLDFDEFRWTIHERSNTDVDFEMGYDSPQYGRRYDIFYNHLAAGKLVIAAAPMSAWRGRPYNGEISATIKISFPVRLLDFHDIAGFLSHIALYLEFCPGKVSRADISARVNQHLLPLMWRIDLEDENSWMYDDIDMHFSSCFPFAYYDAVAASHGWQLHAERMQEVKAR